MTPVEIEPLAALDEEEGEFYFASTHDTTTNVQSPPPPPHNAIVDDLIFLPNTTLIFQYRTIEMFQIIIWQVNTVVKEFALLLEEHRRI